MKVIFNNFDTHFSAELVKMGSDKVIWNSLKLKYFQTSDTSVTTEVTFNTVSKEELLKVAAMFTQLAEEAY